MRLAMDAYNAAWWLLHKAEQFAQPRVESFLDVDGAKVLLGPHIDPLTLGYLRSGIHEIEIREALAKYVRPDDHVLELGTGLGAISVLACRLGRYLTTVEANPDLRPILRATFALNEVTPRSHVGWMLARDDGTALLARTGSVVESSATVPRDDVVPVQTVAAQSFIDDTDPDFVIMDIEGGEVELAEHVTGFSNARVVVIEVHVAELGPECAETVGRWMHGMGYTMDPPTRLNRSFFWKPNYCQVWRRP